MDFWENNNLGEIIHKINTIYVYIYVVYILDNSLMLLIKLFFIILDVLTYDP